MNEVEAIIKAANLEPLDQLKYYMIYFIETSTVEYDYRIKRKTFAEFKSHENCTIHDTGHDWKERGFASQRWINLSAGSLFHSVYHGLL